MAGKIELDPGGTELRIRFDYDPYIVAEIKSLPRRRWDPGQKAWRVPVGDLDAALAVLMRHGFDMAPEVTGLLAGTHSAPPPAAPAKARPAPAVRPSAADSKPATAPSSNGAVVGDALTISTLNERVRQALRGAFPDSVWVVGEIVDYDKNKGRDHVFFALVEKRQGEEKVTAQVAVALFKDVALRIARQLEKSPDPMTLRDGIAVRMRVRVDFYPAQGRFQLIVEEIDPSYTLGQLALQREQILRELRELGLHERNKSLPMPVAPLRIAVLTSPDSDGWNDFHKELERSGIGFSVTIYAVKVQGDDLRPTMLKGLAWFAKRSDEHDVLCILRGGGSRTDLAWFDDREVAMSVAKHPLKVLCGIGHQRDQSVLDVIAHSEKTPTALAACLVGRVQEALLRLDQQTQRLLDLAREGVRGAHERLTGHGQRLREVVRSRIEAERHGLAERSRRLVLASDSLVRSRRAQLGHAVARLGLLANASCGRERLRLEKHEARQRLLDPKAVLRRGYVLVRSGEGRILTRAAAVEPGAALSLQFRDGRVTARAEHKQIESEE